MLWMMGPGEEGWGMCHWWCSRGARPASASYWLRLMVRGGGRQGGRHAIIVFIYLFNYYLFICLFIIYLFI
jgi:hypothetical protein